LGAWVGLGLPAPEFWGITLREADVVMRAEADRQMRAKRIGDGRTYTLAQLVSYSVNDPKRMPRFDKVFPDGKARARQTPEEIHALMTEWVETSRALEASRDG
jgi:hypothetical protein